MKNIFKFLFAFGVSGLMFSSCGDSYLETPVQGAVSSDVLAADENGVNASLISVYKMLNGYNGQGNPWGAAPSNYTFNYASDDAHKGSELSDGANFQQNSLYKWDPGLSQYQEKFSAIYEGVRRSNNTIQLANRYKEAGGSATFVDRITGEALFLRAWYHFDGYKIFVNIPYYNEEDADFRKKNDVPVLPLIIADLEKAVTLLPDVRSQVGRSDKAVARALLGKAKLFAKDYAGAKAAFDAVVATNRFELAPCYLDNFNIATQNNKESLFAHQASVNDGDGNGSNTNYLERLGAPHNDSHTGCCGFNQPTQDLVNAFQVDANGLPVANWNANRLTVNATTPVDPRLDFTAGRTGVPYLDWGLHKDSWIRGSGWAGMYSTRKNMKLTSDAAGPGWTTNQLHAKNVEFIRYADVLLMLAECEVEIGSLERARELVNMIRDRADNCAQGPVGGPLVLTDIKDARITWANYEVKPYTAAWSDKAAARDAVRRERRLELAFEGHRLFDLRRWGTLEPTINAYRAYETKLTNMVNGVEVRIAELDGADAPAAKHYAFPLPSVQIDLAGGNLTQNTGF
ncbi:MAG: RagB/SusD family nutrient uptake outer membrane protein [Saprospiraceae bacterium]|nr:RagB/SusD family nutrient uptake outer membrane protein [Saprospiraceae bacterium]MBP7642875.1 RagB/SusD family nutrient uptake outer membrane protein [Saprospiraceae bacterium]